MLNLSCAQGALGPRIPPLAEREMTSADAASRKAIVMVMGSRRSRPLLEALDKAGVRPALEQSMPKALAALEQNRVAAVVVDRARVDVDALEFVLNVRDVDSRLPVLIVGRSDDRKSDATLAAQNGTHLVDEPDSYDTSVVPAVMRILEMSGTECR